MAGRWYGDWTIDDRIVLPPNPDGRGVSIQVEGRLAGIVALATGREPPEPLTVKGIAFTAERP